MDTQVKHKPAIGKFYLYTNRDMTNTSTKVLLEVAVKNPVDGKVGTVTLHLPGGVWGISDATQLRYAKALLTNGGTQAHNFIELGGAIDVVKDTERKERDRLFKRMLNGEKLSGKENLRLKELDRKYSTVEEIEEMAVVEPTPETEIKK